MFHKIASQKERFMIRGSVQRSYLLVLWVQVPPLQFSVWQCSYIRQPLEVTLRLKARKVCEPVRMTLRMTKTVPITGKKGNGKEVCRLADEVDKWRSWNDDKPGGARTSGFMRDSGYTSPRLSAGIGMSTQPKS